MFKPTEGASYFSQIDIIKCVMAIIVVAVHTHPQTVIGNPSWERFFSFLYQLPVPFFFTVSGFFLWNKIVGSSKGQKLNRIWKWLKHVLLLYMLWTAFYLPYTIYGFWIEQTGIVTSIAIFFRNLFFVGENYFSWPLWYLLGMCVAGLIIYVFTKAGLGIKSMMTCALALVFLGCCLDWCHDNGSGNEIVSLYYKLFRSTRNGFFLGFPYMVAGILIAEKGCIKNNFWLTGLASVSIAFLIKGYSLALIPLVYFGVQGLMKLPMAPQRFPSTTPYRMMSNVIYFTHMIWVGCFVLFFAMDYSISVFLSTLCMCLVTSWMVIRNVENKWVRLLFR